MSKYFCFILVVLISFSYSLFADDVSLPQELQNALMNHKGEDHFWSDFLNMVTTLGLIVCVLLLASWFFKKHFNTQVEQLNTSSQIKILEKRNISPKTSVYLLEVEGKMTLIAESHNGITKL